MKTKQLLHGKTLLLSGLLVACGSTDRSTIAPPSITALSVAETPQESTLDVTFHATASSQRAIIKVEFYDGSTKIGEDTTAPYAASKTYGVADNGSRTITAKAIDSKNNVGSKQITLNVDVVPPPTVTSLSASTSTLTSAGDVTFTAEATALRGITKVAFYDGNTQIGEDTSAPYTTVKTYGIAENGTRTITAKAFGSNGKTATKDTSVAVTLTNPNDPNDPNDSNEPNDAHHLGKLLTIGTPSEKAAIAGKSRDYDYYKLEAKAGDKLKIQARAKTAYYGSTLDPVLYLFDTDGNTTLEKDDDSLGDFDSEIRVDIPTDGTYYVMVTSFNIKDDPKNTDNKASNVYRVEVTRR